jgi:hypothetical protein
MGLKIENFTDDDIVEANDAEVARQPPTALDKAEDNPKGAHVVVADCSRWRVIAPEKFTNCPSPVLARRRATHDWARLKLSLAKRPAKSRQALARRGGTTSRADIGDPSVSQSDQMFDCQPHVVISATTDVTLASPNTHLAVLTERPPGSLWLQSRPEHGKVDWRSDCRGHEFKIETRMRGTGPAT